MHGQYIVFKEINKWRMGIVTNNLLLNVMVVTALLIICMSLLVLIVIRICNPREKCRSENGNFWLSVYIE